MRADSETLTPDSAVGRLRGYGWVARFWVVIVVFALITVFWSNHVDVPIRDPRGSMFMRKALLSVAMFIVLALIDSAVRVGRRAYRPRLLLGKLRERWSPERLLLTFTGLFAYHLVYLNYHNLKSWVVFNGFQDEALLRLDKWMTFGHSPAVVMHDLLGQHVAAIVLAEIYEAFSSIVPFSFVACLVFADRIRDGYVFLTAAIWAWIIGVGSYYLIPSLGPFASAPQDFKGLTHTFINTRQDTLLANRQQLLDHPEAHDSFASIGAFASLHTGFTFMIVLMLSYYGLRRLTRVMTVFLLATMVATIYFGYHFIIDDIAGLLLGLLAVALAQVVIYPKRKIRFRVKS